MSSRMKVVPSRVLATSVALTFVLCLLGAHAAAQVTIQPKDEIFGGYSYLHVSGRADFGVKVQDLPAGFDASNTFYFPRWHNLGVVVDGSGHFNRDHDYTGIGFVLAGLQYKYHTDSLSPFVRVMGGAATLSPAYPPTPPNGKNEWKGAFAAGGGLDWAIGHRFALRLIQVDYIYTKYDLYCSAVLDGMCVPTNLSSTWNNLRVAAGAVINLGNYTPPIPPSASCTAQPNEVTEGEPVTVTATGSNFNPKHTVTYAWTTNGGKLDATDKQSARVDTTGVAAGSYAANATVSDPKMKKGGTASCSANFTVKAKPMNPPQVSCSANPATVKAGDASTITATATSPDNAQITGYSYTASAGRISGAGTTATLDTAGMTAAQTVSVTVTASDARNLTGSGTCTVNVEVPPPPPSCSKINSIQFPDKRRPWRVDNTAKAILDDVASRLKADPNAKIDIVGYADGEKAPMEGTGKKRHAMNLAAQRAVNAKAYLVQQQGIDPSRIGVRSGTGQQKLADIIWLPQGADENTCAELQNTTPVDESMVKPSVNAYPKPRMAPKRHHKAGMAGAAQSTGEAAAQGTEAAAKKTGHAVKKAAKKTKDAMTPQQ